MGFVSAPREAANAVSRVGSGVCCQPYSRRSCQSSLAASLKMGWQKEKHATPRIREPLSLMRKALPRKGVLLSLPYVDQRWGVSDVLTAAACADDSGCR